MTQLAAAAPSPAPCPPPSGRNAKGDTTRRRLALVVIASGMFMAVLDSTIVNIALPALRAAFNAPVSVLAWIVDAYTLSFAALIMLGGAASDRFGARRVYLLGLGLFVAASAACGLSPGVSSLIAARAAQGLGAALFLPASLTLVQQTFDDQIQRARAIAGWAGVASVAASAGPLVGGVLIDALGWRSAFLINLPIGCAGLVLTWLCVAGRGGSAERSFDAAGQIAAIALLAALCFLAIEMPGHSVASAWVWMPMLIALVAGGAFIAIERRALHPMVPLAWFGQRVFASMTAVGALSYVGYFGLLFVLSIYLQDERHLSARAAGFSLLPMTLSLSVGNMLSRWLTGRLAPTRIAAGGLALGALALPGVAMALAHGRAMGPVYVALALFGLGMASSVAPMISSVMEQAPPAQSGVASGLLNAMRQIGSLLGVALASAAVALAPALQTAVWVVAAAGCVAFAASALLAYRCTPVPRVH